MLIPLALVLERAIRDAGIPIDGVSIGDPNNRATWSAFYQATATPQQRTQGDTILATLDTQDATTLANIKADIASNLEGLDYLTSAIQALYEAIPSPSKTLIQVRNRAIQILLSKL